MGIPTGWEFVVLLLVLLLLFGAKRLPETARGLGRSLRIFKAETRGLREDDPPAVAAVSAASPVLQRELVVPVQDDQPSPPPVASTRPAPQVAPVSVVAAAAPGAS